MREESAKMIYIYSLKKFQILKIEKYIEEEEFFGLTTSLFLFKIRRSGRCVLRPSSGGKFPLLTKGSNQQPDMNFPPEEGRRTHRPKRRILNKNKEVVSPKNSPSSIINVFVFLLYG